MKIITTLTYVKYIRFFYAVNKKKRPIGLANEQKNPKCYESARIKVISRTRCLLCCLYSVHRERETRECLQTLQEKHITVRKCRNFFKEKLKRKNVFIIIMIVQYAFVVYDYGLLYVTRGHSVNYDLTDITNHYVES